MHPFTASRSEAPPRLTSSVTLSLDPPILHHLPNNINRAQDSTLRELYIHQLAKRITNIEGSTYGLGLQKLLLSRLAFLHIRVPEFKHVSHVETVFALGNDIADVCSFFLLEVDLSIPLVS
jgi:hypothetical protein